MRWFRDRERPSDQLEQQRQQMLDGCIARGIADQRVLTAIGHVRREDFVAPDSRHQAYGDHPLPIDCGQTISQPFTVAFMSEAAGIAEGDRVLEVGTGSGYGAAVLSLLAQEVHTIERMPVLAAQASERLRRYGYSNVHVHLADGTLGLPEEQPFDAIIVTAGAKTLPAAYAEQLTHGGRIVIPIGPSRRGQTMYRFTLSDGELVKEDLGRFSFVPLVGQQGWQE